MGKNDMSCFMITSALPNAHCLHILVKGATDSFIIILSSRYKGFFMRL